MTKRHNTDPPKSCETQNTSSENRGVAVNHVDVKASDVVRAFDQFVNKIREAFIQPSELSMTAEENERMRYAVALGLVSEFFRTLQVPFASRFFELGFAIFDLNAGIPSDLLTLSDVKGRKLKGNKPSDSQLWRARARIALGLHALMRSRKIAGSRMVAGSRRASLGAAATDIAKKYPQLDALAGGNSAAVKDLERQTHLNPGKKLKGLPETIVNWRKAFMSSPIQHFEETSRIPNWEAVLSFDYGKKGVEAIDDVQKLQAFADKQLAAAAEFAKVLRAAKQWRSTVAKRRRALKAAKK